VCIFIVFPLITLPFIWYFLHYLTFYTHCALHDILLFTFVMHSMPWWYYCVIPCYCIPCIAMIIPLFMMILLLLLYILLALLPSFVMSDVSVMVMYFVMWWWCVLYSLFCSSVLSYYSHIDIISVNSRFNVYAGLRCALAHALHTRTFFCTPPFPALIVGDVCCWSDGVSDVVCLWCMPTFLWHLTLLFHTCSWHSPAFERSPVGCCLCVIRTVRRLSGVSRTPPRHTLPHPIPLPVTTCSVMIPGKKENHAYTLFPWCIVQQPYLLLPCACWCAAPLRSFSLLSYYLIPWCIIII